MRRRYPASLAGRLFVRVMLLILAIGLAMAATTFWAARREIDREADGQLTTATNVLYALMQDELTEKVRANPVLTIDDGLLSGEDLRGFRAGADWRMFVISRDGRRILASDTAPPDPLIPRRTGFIRVSLAAGTWRVYGLAAPATHLLIQVGERVEVRDRLIADVARNLLMPLMVLFVGSAALLWLSLHDGLLHLRRFSAALRRRGPGSTLRFSPAEWPSELAPLVVTINDLLDRVDAALSRERQFTDDAAHQLRTPLAALKLQIQALMRTNEGGHADAAASLLTSVNRASQLVAQMLTLARLDGGAAAHEPIDIVERVKACMAEQALTAARRDVALAFESNGSDAVGTADGAALDLVLSNLLDNAIKHTPGGSTVTMAWGDSETQIVLTITDEGPGIPKDKRAAVLQRFYRGDDGGSGAGLGLAIVAGALDVLNGDLVLGDGPGGRGLRATVTIPR